jgi:O-antigen ligase
MHEVQSPFHQSPAVRWVFAAGLVAIPFDAVQGIGALGELGNELSFPFFAIAIALALILSAIRGTLNIADSLVVRVAGIVLALIFLSLLFNLTDILSADFRERGGLNKFATSLLVVLYGLALAWLAEQMEPERFLPLLARFICWSAMFSIFYIMVELWGRSGAFGGAFSTIDAIVHSRQADVVNPWDGSLNEKVMFGWDQRFRSVSFEPPAFGNYTGFAWPWVWFAALKVAPERKARAWTLLIVFTLIIVVAASRTGLLMLIVNLAMIALLAAVYSGKRGNSEAAVAARMIVPAAIGLGALVAGVLAAVHYNDIVKGVLLGDSVSNLSRLGFQVAAFNIFAANPMFGVGLGQFGFHVSAHMPDWAFLSPEVGPMLTYPLAPWPNVYSIYARIAAELGVAGLIGWVVLWVGLAFALAGQLRRDADPRGPTITWHYPVILNCVGVLFSGFTTDTFRTPMIWIALGLGCGLLARARRSGSAALSASPATG